MLTYYLFIHLPGPSSPSTPPSTSLPHIVGLNDEAGILPIFPSSLSLSLSLYADDDALNI